MKIKFFCPFWGNTLNTEAFLERAIDAGYDGVEASAIAEGDPGIELFKLCQREKLPFIAQHWDVFDRNLDTHISEYLSRLQLLAKYEPIFINSHSGRDLFTEQENLKVFKAAADFSKANNVEVVHETHRGRATHTAWDSAKWVSIMPDLKLTLDMSHWCAVSESYLQDQTDFIQTIVPHVVHIHARVGHPQAAQVSDPRAPEWDQALKVHLAIWDKVVESCRTRGLETLTIVPEFGPDPYMPSIPFTQAPIANQWDINVYMMKLLKDRYRLDSASA